MNCKYSKECGAYYERDRNCTGTFNKCLVYKVREEVRQTKDYYKDAQPHLVEIMRHSNLMCWEEEA